MKNKDKNEILNDIQRTFIKLLIDNGEIEVEEASKKLGVSKATIYNYFNNIKQLSFERRKGKLVLEKKENETQKSNKNDPFFNRLSKGDELKKKVANKIVKEILKPDDVIFLDCGSANYYIATQIIEHQMKDLKIITTNPHVFVDLHKYEELSQISVIGGIYSADRGSFYGNWVDTLLNSLKDNYRIKKAFIGADGISIHNDEIIIYLINEVEKDQKSKIISMADEVYFPLDQNKFGRVGAVLDKFKIDKQNQKKAIIGLEEGWESNGIVEKISKIEKSILIAV